MTQRKRESRQTLQDNPMDNYLGYHLRRLTAALTADISSHLVPLSLRPSEASILIYMQANPDQKQSDIGRALGIQRANMAPIIGSLEARGLCQRFPVDGRSASLALTDQGVDAATEARAIFDAHEQRCFGDLDKGARAQLLALLDRVYTG